MAHPLVAPAGRGRPEGLSGGIVLTHLASHRRTDRPHESLLRLLVTLQEEGCRVVTISELLLPKGPPAGQPASPLDAAGGHPMVR